MTFDRAAGVPRALQFSAVLEERTEYGSRRTPVEISYELVSDE
jgi:hypothetical protein